MLVVLDVVWDQRNSCEALFIELCFAFVEGRNSRLETRLKGSAFFLVVSHVETVLHQLFVIYLFLKENFKAHDRLLSLFFRFDG